MRPRNPRRELSTRVMRYLRDFVSGSEHIRKTYVVLSVAYSNMSPHQKEYKCRISRNELVSILENIICATLEYLRQEVYLEGNTYNHYYCDIIHKILEKYADEETDKEKQKDVKGKRLLNLFTSEYETQDAFAYFHVNGLLILCSKHDLCGIYSKGNCIDIVQLFKAIHPIMKTRYVSSYTSIYGRQYECKNEHNDDNHSGTYPIYHIFRICVNTQQGIVHGDIITA